MRRGRSFGPLQTSMDLYFIFVFFCVCDRFFGKAAKVFTVDEEWRLFEHLQKIMEKVVMCMLKIFCYSSCVCFVFAYSLGKVSEKGAFLCTSVGRKL